MNILVVCHYGLYEDLSYSFVHNQIREYAALGHRVRVIIPNGLGKVGRGGGRLEKPLLISLADGVELYDFRYLTLSRYGQRGFNTASAVAAIALQWNQFFSDFRPDVIHAHTLGFDSEIGAWLKRKLNCPLVVTTHGSDTFLPATGGRAADLRNYANEVDRVVCVSSLLRRTLETAGVTNKMDVILNGFNVGNVLHDSRKNTANIIQVGSLIPRKKVDVSLQAIAILKESVDKVRFTVIGSGEEQQNLENLCKSLHITENVVFTGQLPNQEVHKNLAEATFFVMPSIREGFGIVYLEAMAAGCIVIGTQGEGIADLITDGESGFLVPADNPEAIAHIIGDCIQNPQYAAQIAIRGRELAMSMTWENNAQKYLQLFHELINKK